MKFTLEQDTIESALRTYLQANYGLSLRNKEAVMSFTAGRGKNGLSVQVNIKDATIPGDDAVGNNIGAAIVGQNVPKASAAEKISVALASAAPGTVGASLQAASTVAVETQAVEAVADPVVVAEAAPVAVVEAEAAPVVAEAEVAAVTTEAAVAAESTAVPTEEAVKPAAPKTTTGLFA